jgi:outer membrane protein TolC
MKQPRHTIAPMLALILTLPMALAQSGALTLEGAVTAALSANADVANAQSAMRQAQATRAARDADPTALITEVYQARQAAELSGVQANAVRLLVMNDTVTEFLNLAESTDTLEYLTAQAKFSERNLEITRARLASRTATSVDVQRAETELSGARQQLADARAQRPIIAARLGRILCLEKGVEPKIGEPPALKARALDLIRLEDGLDERVPTVVQAAQAVELAELIVKTTDNDYTPGQTKREARTNLENARRALFTERRKAATTLRDAFRAVQDALEGAGVAQKNADTAARTFKNDQVRFQNELISKVQLDASDLTAKKAQYDAAKATNGYWRALAGLSQAAGTDATGLVK